MSAVEVGINLLGPVLLDVTVNGRTTRRPDFPTGNRLEWPHAAPHGVYPALGEDRWVAIAVFDDDQWAGLVDALGHPAWTADPRFATQEDRFAEPGRPRQAPVRLDGRARPPRASWTLLQAARRPAGAVQNAEDLNEDDPQVAHRGLFFEMDHPVIGPARFEGTPDPVLAHRAGQLALGPAARARTTSTSSRRSSASADDEFDELQAEGVM